jgi:hypothetical protein
MIEDKVGKKFDKAQIKLGFFTLVCSAVLLIFIINMIFSDWYDLPPGYWLVTFTAQSNVFVLVWLCGFGITRFGLVDSKFSKFIQNRLVMLAVTLYIAITFFVSVFVIWSVFDGKMTLNKVLDYLHLATPVIMFVYYFLVKGTGEIGKKSYIVLVYIIIYFTVALIIAFITDYGWGDYTFLDPLSYVSLAWYVFALFVLFVGILLLMYGLIKFKEYLDKVYY